MLLRPVRPALRLVTNSIEAGNAILHVRPRGGRGANVVTTKLNNGAVWSWVILGACRSKQNRVPRKSSKAPYRRELATSFYFGLGTFRVRRRRNTLASTDVRSIVLANEIPLVSIPSLDGNVRANE